MAIPENLKEIQKRIQMAAAKSGRRLDDVTLVAVTKTVATETIREALAAGVRVLGENRPQELVRKHDELATDAQWHLIGHLQTNKINKIIDKVALIHSLDSWRLAEALSRSAMERNLDVHALIQVNVAGEASKNGIAPQEAADFLADAAALPGLRICGLMTIAPWVSRAEEVRPVFKQLADMADFLKKNPAGADIKYLSMGMSGDFEVAIEEGANIVRVGTAIFGDRI